MQEAGVNVFDASMNFGHGLHGSLAAVTPFFTAAAYRLLQPSQLAQVSLQWLRCIDIRAVIECS